MSLFNRKQRRAESKIKDARTSQQIQQEYQQACAAVGDRSFQVSILKAQTEELHKRMHALGTEMNTALARETKEKQDAEAAAAKEGKKNEVASA